MKFSYLIVVFVSFFSLSAYSQGIGGIDDGADSCSSGTRYYRDADGDGYGDPDDSQCALSAPSGYVQNNMDCDDSSALYQPGRWWYRDADGDGFGESSPTTVSCMQPSGYVSNNDDDCPGEAGPDNGCPEPDPLPDPGSFSDENFVFSRIYTKESSSPHDALQEITYYDGLGRPMQHIGIGQAGGSEGEDIITHIGYDDHGRQDKEYLPYSGSGTPGTYRSGAESATDNYYLSTHGSELNSSPNPFSETRFEASPLSRTEEQGAPGAAWAVHPTADTDHTIKFAYERNSLEEVRLYKVNLSSSFVPSLVQSTGSYYETGQLYKSITKDENWQPGQSNPKDHTTEEFKDKQGRVVLKRTYGDSDVNGDGDTNDSGEQGAAHDTYYVYDGYGNLTYVIPPKVVTSNLISTDVLDDLCYQYRYDDRNRLVEKKIPGKGWEDIIYNDIDQPILVQDANLRAQNKWQFTAYDAFGRVAYTGLVYHPSWTSVQMRSHVESGNVLHYVNRSTSYMTINGTKIYYNKFFANSSDIPNSAIEIQTINYYDQYGFDLDGLSSLSSTVYDENVVNRNNYTSTRKYTKGLLTGSKVRVLGTSNWITTLNGYDKKGNLIISKSKNPYLGTQDAVTYDLDFTGKIMESTTTHTGSNVNVSIVDKFTYDHMGRLLKQTQKIGSEDEELIVFNRYSPEGNLIAKKVGGDPGSAVATFDEVAGLQTIDYTYNIRGWLKGINDPGTSLGDDLFAFGISYNDPSSGTALFNGNISQTKWKTANDHILRNYNYLYDPLNRLTSADGTGSFGYDMNAAYDKNGNIQALSRFDGSAKIDGLDYEYDLNGVSNQLLSVSDDGTIDGFNDGNPGDDYSYDVNGNITSDLNKGIPTNGISYNHLNLPTSITLPGGTISYTYDATGVKLQKKVVESGLSNKYTFYAGNYIYKRSGDSGTGTLKFFNHAEGYVEPDGNGGFDYVYQYKDHLGNVRVSYTDLDGNRSISASTEILQERNYYPFGLEHKGYNSVVNGTEKNYMTYNGKELEKELGLEWTDYGARRYMRDLGRWTSIDHFSDIYSSFSPYNFVVNNPVNAVDPDGQLIIFVNGNHYGSGGKKKYWGSFADKVGIQLKDENHIFVDGSMGGFAGLYGLDPRSVYRSQHLSATSRYQEGYAVGKAVAQAIIKGLAAGETIKIITHSMGGAWGRGLARALEKAAKDMEITDRKLLTLIADFDPFQASSLIDVEDTFIQQFLHTGLLTMADQRDENADKIYEDEDESSHSISSFTSDISKLREGTYEWNSKTEEWDCTSCKEKKEDE